MGRASKDKKEKDKREENKKRHFRKKYEIQRSNWRRPTREKNTDAGDLVYKEFLCALWVCWLKE